MRLENVGFGQPYVGQKVSARGPVGDEGCLQGLLPVLHTGWLVLNWLGFCDWMGRESAVCQAVQRGNTSESIFLPLGTSTQSVHRKHTLIVLSHY